jgi:hypothetical protein
MTDKISVLIPSRNETYLNQTIQSCFDNAAGEIEVVVTLEGYWPSDWKDITARYSNLHTVHHGEPRGLRAAINSAAASAISRGARYLLKLDAHCMLDQGFDEKLKVDMEDNWIVVPRRKRLDAENWQVQDVGKPDIDYHYISFPDNPNDFGGAGLNGKVWEERARERAGNPEYDIDDEMSSQGSCWFMTADYFRQLELMDEASYGPFWNEAQELFLKCWLSGGRGVINKKTWYAHLHKGKDYKGTTGKSGRGYRLDESWLTQGRNHTMKWLYNEAWARQALPFKWLIERFWPVPGWPEDWEVRIYGDVKQKVAFGLRPDANPVGRIEAPISSLEISSNGLLFLLWARYGIGFDHPSQYVNVLPALRDKVLNNSLDIVVTNHELGVGNPFRGKKKRLQVAYRYGGNGEKVVVERDEKDWLIIGQMQRLDVRDGENPIQQMPEGFAEAESRAKPYQEAVIAQRPALYVPGGVNTLVPTTPTALNDYLIRKFSISDRRLRAPMPIELRDFHRDNLAQLFAELGFKRGAEVGVAEGIYSEILLKANPECELLLVDPWHAYSDNPQNKSKEKHEFAYREVLRKTKDYAAHAVMQVSMEAVQDVKEGSLDFCYIDGNHSFDYVIQDLIEWSKRVRSGGIVSGDDYYALDEKRWGAGPVEAVQAYTKAHRIPIWFIFQGHKSVDFMWVKP